MQKSSKSHVRQQGAVKGKKNSNKRRPQSRDNRAVTKAGAFGGDAGNAKTNDPSWYNLDPRITKDAATFPYAIPTGTRINTEHVYKSDYESGPRMPGLMAMRLAPTVGRCVDAHDPINMAAQQMYAFITHANSRNTSYDAADLMQYTLAMAEVYSYVEWLKRLYGTARMYHYNNKYMPRAFFGLNGVDAESILSNLADFRLGINLLVNKVASFAVPDTMPIFARKQFLYSSIYSDGLSEYDQLYMFVPDGFYRYSWTENELDYAKGTPEDVEGLLRQGNQMIDCILGNNDLGTMNGDIQKAYGNNVLKLSTIDENYTTAPVYNQGVLEQFSNATVVPNLVTTSLDIQSIYDESDSLNKGMSLLYSRPVIHMPDYVGPSNIVTDREDWISYLSLLPKSVITTDVADPDAPYNVELTRLVTKGFIDPDLGRVEDLICGTEIAVDVLIAHDPDQEPISVLPYYTTYSDCFEHWVDDPTTGAATYVTKMMAEDNALARLQLYNYFKYAPTIYRVSLNGLITQALTTLAVNGKLPGDAGNWGFADLSFKRSKYTTLDLEDLENIHKVALLNLFYIPRVGF